MRNVLLMTHVQIARTGMTSRLSRSVKGGLRPAQRTLEGARQTMTLEARARQHNVMLRPEPGRRHGLPRPGAGPGVGVSVPFLARSDLGSPPDARKASARS